MENKEYVKDLAIVITTYNRKQELIEQLKTLECQEMYDKYSIIIYDNNSNYCVQEELNNNFSNNFLSIISVHKRKYNLGGDCNIALSLIQTQAKWVWLLSDDDLTLPDSIEIVLKDIEKYSDYCWLKYSISGFVPFNDKPLYSIKDIFDTCSSNGHTYGELVFMSNNVYNMNLLDKYIGNILSFTNTCFSQIVGPLFSIKYGNVGMMFRSASITKYVCGRASYKLHAAFLNFPHFICPLFPLNKEELQSFKVLFNVTGRELLLSLFEVDNKTLRIEYFKQYVIYYKWGNFFMKFIYICLFLIMHYLGFTNNTISKIRKFKHNYYCK